jgi:hypothetical protein
MNPHRLSLTLPLLLAVALAVAAPVASRQKPALTAEDRKYLDGLMKDFLFDPQGAERVSIKMVVRTVWTDTEVVQVGGWFVPGKGDMPGRVYFTDGASVAAPPAKEMTRIDFAAACKARYAAAPPKKDDFDRDEIFNKMRQTALGAVADHDLALAAWLYRLGHEELAARALAAARQGKGDPRTLLRADLAWSAFAGMVHAYMVRADEEALAHGQRLLRLYADEVKKQEYHQAAQVVEELKRRQKKGTFGKEPAGGWPTGFDTWDAKKKTAYLIDALEEVDALQMSQPGGVDLASDRRVAELIRLGDVAVPDLIDTLEKDERLTRSVHFWRDFARSRTVLSVREAALTALMSILRIRAFEPRSTGDNFTSRGDEAARETAQRLRAYWKTYGGLPFDERMMKMLTDPQAAFEIKREAAVNLATLTWDRRLGTMVWTDSSSPPTVRKPNPALVKFQKPTAAEAILAALDADLSKHANINEYQLRHIFETYLRALVELGDQRVAAALARRAGIAANAYERNQWAKAAKALGEPRPLVLFAEDFRAGKLTLSAGQRGEEDLQNMIANLSSLDLPEAERALDALTGRKHPYHHLAVARVLKERVEWSDSNPWFNHAFCLRLLREALEDPTPTGVKYHIAKDLLWRTDQAGQSSAAVPAWLADPAARRDEAAERVGDVAAGQLQALVAGLPLYHPLLKDADRRLTEFKAAFDRFAGNYRRASRQELEALQLHRWTRLFLPDIRPLGRAATADDVKAGKAVFHQGGKGKVADLQLPAVAILKRDQNMERPPQVLIVQAEVGPDGKAMYGVITRADIRMMPAEELTGIKPLAELEKEE